MSTLNEKISQLSSTNDTKRKLSIGQDIIDYLGNPENSVECEDLGSFIDMLVPFMQSSNFKVNFRPRFGGEVICVKKIARIMIF